MKQLPQRDNSRFNAHLRHYHRSGPGAYRTWDEWVDGKAKPGSSTNWLKVVAIGFVSLLALGGAIAGIVVELV